MSIVRAVADIVAMLSVITSWFEMDFKVMYHSAPFTGFVHLLFFFTYWIKKLRRMALSLPNLKVLPSEIHNNRTILINQEVK